MIDKENEIYTFIKKAILEEYPSCNVSSVYSPTVAKFPYVSIYMIDAFEPTEYRDTSLEEKFTTMSFQIDVYSNDSNKAKSICKGIISIVDKTLRRKNFKRDVLTPVPNQNDASIYRITAQYSVTANKTHFYSAS
jgi:hypothetical protein